MAEDSTARSTAHTAVHLVKALNGHGHGAGGHGKGTKKTRTGKGKSKMATNFIKGGATRRITTTKANGTKGRVRVYQTKADKGSKATRTFKSKGGGGG